MIKPTLRNVFALGLFTCLFFFLWLSPLSHRLDRVLHDSIFALRMEKIPSNITIIEIDADSLEKHDIWPWPRGIYAQALKTLSQVDTGSVFIDIDFSSVSTTEEDNKLIDAIDALAKTRTVALPAFIQHRTSFNEEKLFRSPIEGLKKNTHLVSVNVFADSEGFIRHIPPGFYWESTFHPTAGVFISGKTLDSSNQRSHIDFSISNESFQRVSIHRLIDGTVPLTELEGRTLFIGSTAIELGDQLTTPLHASIPGVEIQALITSTMERGKIVSIDPLYNFIAVGILCLLAASLIYQHQWLYGLFCVGCTTALLLCVAVLGHQVKYIVAVGAGIISIAATYFSITLLQLNETLRARARLKLGLEATQTQLFTITEASSDLIISIDAHGKIIAINSKAEALIEYDGRHSGIGEIEKYIPLLKTTSLEALTQAITETTITTNRGQNVPVELSVSTHNLSGKTNHTFIIRDISERKRKEARLRYEADHDVLTGLSNRNALERRIANDLEKHKTGTLVAVGLDHFREVNENFGSETGDSILIAVGLRLLNTAGADGTCARLSGDHFGIWYPNLDSNPVTQERIQKILYEQQRPYVIEESEIEIAASLGITTFTNKDSDVKRLFTQANAALYEAQRKKNAVEFFDESTLQDQKSFISMIPMLRQAINNNELVPYFQPKIDLRTNQIIGSEVLARWPLPDGGFIPPDRFIHIAENSRLIAPLTYHFFQLLLKQEDQWREAGIQPKLAVNLSARLLGNENFILELCSYSKRPSPYFDFELEVTESAVMDGKEKAQASLNALRDHGYRIAVDDYGTGYSSLAYLKDLAPHTIKIDRSFVTNVSASKTKQAITRSTVYMAQEMGMEIVAEGVETPQDQQFLKELGCDIGQGYFYSRPLPQDEFFQFCENWDALQAKQAKSG